MTLEEFTRIVDLYGAESARWPKALRAECETFLANNAPARMLLDQERVVDPHGLADLFPNLSGDG